MKLRTATLTAAVFLGLAAPAAANCVWQGVSYGAGYKMCQPGGWLMECTVAGYWKAIGQCKAPDMTPMPGATAGKALPSTAATVATSRQIAAQNR